MSSRSGRMAKIVGLVGVGGYLLAGPGTGCFGFTAESTLTAADFCFIFDCQSGILGGTIDPCAGIGSGNPTFGALDGQRPLFSDCPVGGP